MSNPLIQIDDVVREMTDEEYAVYLAEISNYQPLTNDEKPTSNA
jgi:hypothetical protein